MTRIAEMQKKYPTIPQEVIVKWDVLNRGVRDTEGLDKLSRWSRSASATCQTYDHDVTLKEVMAKRPDRVKEGFVKRPRSFYMKNGMACGLQRDSRSDYEIMDLGDGKFALFEGEEKVDLDLYFPPPPGLKKDEPLASRGNPISKLFAYPCGLSPHCFMMVPVRYCEYFSTGEQCKFCNFNGTQADATSVGLGRVTTINLEEAVEAYKIHSSRVRILHGLLESGGIMSSGFLHAPYQRLWRGSGKKEHGEVEGCGA